MVNNVTTSYCDMFFEDQTIYISSLNKKLDVLFGPPGSLKSEVKKCFSMDLPEDYFSEGHDTYLFISAFSGSGISNEHIIHKIRFTDPHHLHDGDDQDTDEDRKEFFGKAKDVIRKGAITQYDEFTIESYNKQLVRHNKLYSKIVSDFISNSETIISHLAKLPHHDVVEAMAEEADNIKSKFAMLNEQFTAYNTDMASYKKYLHDVLAER
mmetsp:Transcript_35149/g.53884  ORF Transcript_35149/g.53884 Transcript_35149/m.53884 type:complete len:210 (+) Transcript_35149:525-1154(+)